VDEERTNLPVSASCCLPMLERYRLRDQRGELRKMFSS